MYFKWWICRCTIRNNNGGVLVFGESDRKGPLVARQLWNLYEIWAAKASDCHVSALLEASAVLEVQLRSVRKVNCAFKMMNLAFKMMNLAFKNDHL